MHRIYKLAFSLILASATLSACAADDGHHGSPPAGNTASITLIRSPEDLDLYLRTTPNSPLDRLSPEAKQRFLDSLVFGENSLGSYRYADLQLLSRDEANQILSLFGAERTLSMFMKSPDGAGKPVTNLMADHENYWCALEHTCRHNAGDICMSGC